MPALVHLRLPHATALGLHRHHLLSATRIHIRRIRTFPLSPYQCRAATPSQRDIRTSPSHVTRLLSPAKSQHSLSSRSQHLARISFDNKSTRHITLLHSNTPLWTTILLAATLTSAVIFGLRTEQARPTLVSETHSRLPENIPTALSQEHNMTAETLPGRPGTLTAAEEEKLREFWIAVLQVFGVLDAHKPDSEPHVEPAHADAPKKKRLGLFRKKHQDGVDSPKSATNVADGDDKYGQTKEYHEALASQSPESLRATFWSMVKHDHPDALLLRFLRARKWDVEKALVMMVSTMRWRSTEMHVDDDIMKNGEAGALEDLQSSDAAKKTMANDFLTQMRMGKSFLHGLDKDERPMCFVRARLHRAGDQSEQSMERYTVYVIETARMILSPPVDTACVVFDLTGFSMANMDYAPVKFMIKCFEANYPESLGVVLVHKAPWVFQGIWKIIRGWLDPVVAAKVQFTNSEAEMEAYVPRSRIITELGGSENWEFKYAEPVAGENDKMKDTATRDRLLQTRSLIVDDYEKRTLEWIRGEGNVDDIRRKRHEIAIQLKEDYWALDPYIRARSCYDRAGLINPGGKLQFYPPAANHADTTTPAKPETSVQDLD